MERKKVSCAAKNMLARSIRSADLHNINLEVNQMYKLKAELDNCDSGDQEMDRSMEKRPNSNNSDSLYNNEHIQALQRAEADQNRKRKAENAIQRWSHSGFEEQNRPLSSSPSTVQSFDSPPSLSPSSSRSSSPSPAKRSKTEKKKKKKKKSKKSKKSKKKKKTEESDRDSDKSDPEIEWEEKSVEKKEKLKKKKKKKKSKKKKSKKNKSDESDS